MIYIKRSDGGYFAFQGMAINVINALLAELGMTGIVITKEEYDMAIKMRTW